jgi:hypothetical protein
LSHPASCRPFLNLPPDSGDTVLSSGIFKSLRDLFAVLI